MTKASLLVSFVLLAPLAGSAAGSESPAVRDLLTAARRGDVPALRKALDGGAGVNAVDPTFRQTALIRAAMFGQVEAARALLALGAEAGHAAAPDGMRAIHWAARQGSAEMVRVLAAGGADVNATDGTDATPLEHGVVAGSAAAVQALLAASAWPERMRQPVSTLIGAALNDEVPGARLDALLALVRGGRDLERASGIAGERTALLALANRANRPGAERVAEALVAAGANIRATDEKGRTARQVVDAWIPSQRVASYRKTLEAVAAILRRAEGGR